MSEARAMVASGHPLVSRAAITMMEKGGNAFDGVVAAGFMAAVAEPALTSLGGGGFLLARSKAGHAVVFDFFTDTPGRGLVGGDLEPHFFPVTVDFTDSHQDFNVGRGSVAVPGNLKGFLHVHNKLGRLPFSEVVEPAIHAARHGVVLNENQAHFLALLKPIMTYSEAGQRLYCPNGRYLGAGDLLVNKELAGFLESLAVDQRNSFYCGEMAQQIAADMVQGQGLLTEEDLVAYQVIEREPIKISYRGRTFYSNPPPSFGGMLISAGLDILSRTRIGETNWGSASHLEKLATVLQQMEALRDQGIDSLANSNGDQLDPGSAPDRLNSRGTTHVSVVDCEGNVASMTTSNGEGSGYIVPGTGIMLNNMMGEDDLHPDGFHASPPGQRVASMMSPSLLENQGRVELVIGSGGSKRIRTAITQVVSNVVDFGRELREAVEAPRMHWDGETMQVEPGVSESALALLRDRMDVNVWQARNVYFGGVHAVMPAGRAAGDPRRGGAAQSFDCP